MTDRELLQQALDALESSRVYVTTREKIKHPEGTEWYDGQIEALRARLAQGELEPLAWMYSITGALFDICPPDADAGEFLPLYAAPPQREWVGLTHEEHMEIMTGTMTTSSRMAAVEAKLKEKNT